jgi:hypothetical protein
VILNSFEFKLGHRHLIAWPRRGTRRNHIGIAGETPVYLASSQAGSTASPTGWSSCPVRCEPTNRRITAARGSLRGCNHRSKLLDAAVMLGAVGGGLSCVAALLLFIGGFGRTVVAANVLLAAFGLALIMTIGSIAAFVGEMVLSSARFPCGGRAKIQSGYPRDSSRTATRGRELID